jgi:hypothetical protein
VYNFTHLHWKSSPSPVEYSPDNGLNGPRTIGFEELVHRPNFGLRTSHRHCLPQVEELERDGGRRLRGLESLNLQNESRE